MRFIVSSLDNSKPLVSYPKVIKAKVILTRLRIFEMLYSKMYKLYRILDSEIESCIMSLRCVVEFIVIVLMCSLIFTKIEIYWFQFIINLFVSIIIATCCLFYRVNKLKSKIVSSLREVQYKFASELRNTDNTSQILRTIETTTKGNTKLIAKRLRAVYETSYIKTLDDMDKAINSTFVSSFVTLLKTRELTGSDITVKLSALESSQSKADQFKKSARRKCRVVLAMCALLICGAFVLISVADSYVGDFGISYKNDPTCSNLIIGSIIISIIVMVMSIYEMRAD